MTVSMAAPPLRKLDPLIQKVKRLLIREGGVTGVRALSRCFRVVDSDGDMMISKQEFGDCLAGYGLSLTEGELNRLMSTFDLNKDGFIGVPEFLTAFRLGIRPKRKAFILRLFNMFDQNRDGRLTLDEFKRGYDASGHPDYLSGRKSLEQIQEEFYLSFDSETNPDGVISRQEFQQHYACVSAGYDTDDEFIAMLVSTWRLDDALGGEPSSHAQTEYGGFSRLDASLTVKNPAGYTLTEKEAAVDLNIRQSASENLIQKIRQLAYEKLPTKCHGIVREFYRGDGSGVGFCSAERVYDVMRSVRLHHFMSDEEMELLCRDYDTRRNGTFDYFAFSFSIVGDLPPSRVMLLERTWKRLPRNKTGKVPVELLISNFVPDLVPEVATGKSTKGQTLSNFLDAWDVSYYPSGLISYEEFEMYYSSISESVPDDSHFRTMILVSWKVWAEEGRAIVKALLDN